jgi:hypothetical protein
LDLSVVIIVYYICLLINCTFCYQGLNIVCLPVIELQNEQIMQQIEEIIGALPIGFDGFYAKK